MVNSEDKSTKLCINVVIARLDSQSARYKQVSMKYLFDCRNLWYFTRARVYCFRCEKKSEDNAKTCTKKTKSKRARKVRVYFVPKFYCIFISAHYASSLLICHHRYDHYNHPFQFSYLFHVLLSEKHKIFPILFVCLFFLLRTFLFFTIIISNLFSFFIFAAMASMCCGYRHRPGTHAVILLFIPI